MPSISTVSANTLQDQFNKKYIGYGIQMPNPFDPVSGKIVTNTGSERLYQSIRYILSTIPGERFFLPDFGCNIHKRVFELNDAIFRDLVINDIREALGNWEPRIEIININPKIIVGDNTVPIEITFRIKQTNMIDNYVYPLNRNIMDLGNGEDGYDE